MTALSANARGIAFMIAAIFLFSSMDALVKHLASRYDVVQLVWARYVGQTVVVVAVLAPRLHLLIRTRHLGLQLLRSGFLFAATFCFFTALTRIDIAAATAIFNIHPLLLTLGAALILRETLGWRRLAGIGAALIGALIIIRPGSDVFTTAAFLPLAAGTFYAAYALTTRFLGRDEPILTSFLYTALIGTVVSSVLVIDSFQMPPPGDAGLFLVVGAIAALGQYFLIRSLTVAEAGVVAPFGYAGVLFSTIWGLAIFAEVPDAPTLLGAVVIVGAGVYVWHRETRARRSPG